MDDAMKRLLTEARDEILSLRRRNEILGAKVGTMELFATVLHTKPAYDQQGYGEDVAWKIDRAIADAAAADAIDQHKAAMAEAMRRKAAHEALDEAMAERVPDPMPQASPGRNRLGLS